MNTHKLAIFVIKKLIGLLICLVVIGLCVLPCWVKSRIRWGTMPSAEVLTNAGEAWIYNNLQTDTHAWACTYNGKLFVCPRDRGIFRNSRYTGWLCAVEGNTLARIKKICPDYRFELVGSYGQWLYYWRWASDGIESARLYCFDLEKHTEEMIYIGAKALSGEAFFCEEGSIYVPLEKDNRERAQSFVHVKAGQVLETVDEIIPYGTDQQRYYVESYWTGWPVKVMVVGEDGCPTELVFKRDDQHVKIFPLEQGFIVHAPGFTKTPLYYVTPDNQAISLFEVPCSTCDTAITIVDGNVYCSLYLRAYLGEDGYYHAYEDDTLVGTYKISLSDYSVQKISDIRLTALYYFGGDHIIGSGRDFGLYMLDTMSNAITPIYEFLY